MTCTNKLSYLILLLVVSIFSCQSNAQETKKQIDLNPTEFKVALEQENNAIILDVRTPKEVSQGVIPGATVINFYDADFKQRIGELDKNKTYFVYCKGGGRSGKTCSTLQDAGVPNTFNLKGGITAWIKEGLPITGQ